MIRLYKGLIEHIKLAGLPAHTSYLSRAVNLPRSICLAGIFSPRCTKSNRLFLFTLLFPAQVDDRWASIAGWPSFTVSLACVLREKKGAMQRAWCSHGETLANRSRPQATNRSPLEPPSSPPFSRPQRRRLLHPPLPMLSKPHGVVAATARTDTGEEPRRPVLARLGGTWRLAVARSTPRSGERWDLEEEEEIRASRRWLAVSLHRATSPGSKASLPPPKSTS
ncbi:hypothetical protein ACQJBY_055467 [Aegilops geniculata]